MYDPNFDKPAPTEYTCDYAPSQYHGAVTTSPLAIASLVSGIVGVAPLTFLGSLIAIITGHLALSEIRASGGRIGGKSLAVIDLVLGYATLGLALVGILLVLAIVALGIGYAASAAKDMPAQAVSVDPAGVQARVIQVVNDHFGVPKARVTPQTRLKEDLESDDLDTVELVMKLEDAFDIMIPDEDAEKFRTVDDLIQSVSAKMYQRGVPNTKSGTRRVRADQATKRVRPKGMVVKPAAPPDAPKSPDAPATPAAAPAP